MSAPASLGSEATDLLQRLIAFNTVNPPGNELDAQRFLEGYLGRAGFECRLLGARPERPNLVARLRGKAEGKTLCLLSHVDTVLATPSEWSVDPWSGEVRDGHVWGRGALDMKGQVACEVAAAAALAESGWRPERGDLLVVVTCDEEAGATLGAQWLCDKAREEVRCDWVVNEGAGEFVDFAGSRYYTFCVGEKGVFRFRLETEGRAGHASIPWIGENALLRMVEVLGRLDGRQPPLDSFPEAVGALEAVLQHAVEDLGAALEEVRGLDPRLADALRPMLSVTLAPTMISASQKENVIPSHCSVVVDCRVPPGLAEDHVRMRVTQLLGGESEAGYRLEFVDHIVGNSSPLDSPLTEVVRDFVRSQDPHARLIPLVLPGFTDSHWFRKAFPECVAYGFFPQSAMSLYDTTPLVHAPDERIALEDVQLASGFYYTLAQRMLA